ncbi:MAG: hypothetical protein IRZ08_04735 [Frankia sp.]|nr:hypothetical protein [Frankia sp.]
MARMMTALLAGCLAWWERRQVAAARGGDRGDVPGWVMVTVMTAALVVAITAIATPALRNMFTAAIDSVTGLAGGDDGG